MSARNIGGSLLPSSEPRILTPKPFRGGHLITRAIPEKDTHGLFYVGSGCDALIASHPNGYSCHALAERLIAQDWKRAGEQADYIVACGGTVDREQFAKLKAAA